MGDQPFMPPVGLEPTISVYEPAKTFRALNRATTGIVSSVVICVKRMKEEYVYTSVNIIVRLATGLYL
jgi:hypothetical protein